MSNEALFWLAYLIVGLVTGLTVGYLFAKDERTGGYPETTMEMLGNCLMPGLLVLAFIFLWPLFVIVLGLGYFVTRVIR